MEKVTWEEKSSPERVKIMQKARPTYTKEFKLEAVHLWQASGKSQSQIARDLGIPDSTLSHWCLRFAEHGKDAFPGSGHLPPLEEENRRLQREIEPNTMLWYKGGKIGRSKRVSG